MLPTDVPMLAGPGGTTTAPPRPDLTATAVAMASRITVATPDRFGKNESRRAQARDALDLALNIFRLVDQSCTRFRGDSDLMRANARPREWVPVDEWCFDALREAYEAYRLTAGRFDPRVLDDLVRLGYARSFSLGGPEPRTVSEVRRVRGALPPWRLGLRAEDRAVRLADPDDPAAPGVDLGGIGKGLAVRWASRLLTDVGVTDHLVEAGGDCYCAGRPADGSHWRVGIEDPHGGDEPIAVLQVSDEAVTTSSVRLRHWTVEAEEVHHLIDPATGRPGGAGLLSVTVVHHDPATAEVWGKVLFLAGAEGIAAAAEQLELPALWVDRRGAIGMSAALRDRLLWRRT